MRTAKLSLSYCAIRLVPAFVSFALVASAQVDVLTQHNDNTRTGVNLRETVLRPGNLTTTSFGLLFKRTLDDQLYTQPLLATGIAVGGGTRDLLYVTTVNNSVYAFDANDAEATVPVWHVNFGTPANLHSANFGCLDMNGQMGIIGTPVIDKKRGVLYVVALTQVNDPSGKAPTFIQRLHELDLSTGADLPESPVVVLAPDFNPLMENQRPALMLANGFVYVGYASHCDKQPYHGFLMAYDAQTLRQISVLNTSPTGIEASIWQSGQGPATDEAGNIYVATGNGSWDGERNFSETFLKLSPRLKLLDWFTPMNHFLLDKRDQDVDSSGATLLPGTHLVVGGGKEGVLYTLDTRNLGHLGDEHALQHFKATASHLHSLVYWQSEKAGDLLFFWGQRDKVKVYKMVDGHLNEAPVMMRDTPNEGHPGAMLSLSANGRRDGVLWAAIHATRDSWHESRPGVLHAYDAEDIRHELWNSLENARRDDCGEYSKMSAPTVANGRVYLASFGTENIGTGQFCVYGLLPAPRTTRTSTPSGVNATIAIGNSVVTWDPVVGARFYRVLRTSSLEPQPRTVGYGLTTPAYTESAPERGEVVSYAVVAVGENGASAVTERVNIASAPRKQMDD